MYEYRVTVVKVIDGDTVDVDIDLGFGVWIKDERVRIMGIDTPESRTRDKEEKVFGLAAKARLKEGKEDTLVTKVMIEEGHAVEYWGQSKDDIVEAHMRNRQVLIENGTITL
jgi:micrococcal nuclease